MLANIISFQCIPLFCVCILVCVVSQLFSQKSKLAVLLEAFFVMEVFIGYYWILWGNTVLGLPVFFVGLPLQILFVVVGSVVFFTNRDLRRQAVLVMVIPVVTFFPPWILFKLGLQEPPSVVTYFSPALLTYSLTIMFTSKTRMLVVVGSLFLAAAAIGCSLMLALNLLGGLSLG